MESWMIRITDYLLAQSWQIAVLTIAVALATCALRNRSAHVRYLLWLIVLAKVLVPPLYSIPVAVLPEPAPLVSIPAPPMTERMMAEHRAPEAAVTEPAGAALVQSQAASPPTVSRMPAQYNVRVWLAMGWLVGVVVLSFYYLFNALRTQVWLQKRRMALSGESASSLESFFAAHGIKHRPRVWLLERINQPFVWGLMRGSIYLPARLLDGKDVNFQASLLGHELSHVVRLDAMINSLQVVAQTMFWFHPFVWWANAKIRAEREKCCDEMTIARLNTLPEEYGGAIVETLAAKYEQARPVPSLAVAGRVKNIEERINTMLKPGKKFYRRPSLIVATTILLMAVLTVPSAVVLTARGEGNAPTESTEAVPIFGDPVNLGPEVNSSTAEYDPHISPDGLSLYFLSRRPGGLGGADIWVTTRKAEDDPWGPPVNLGEPVNTEAFEGAPCISADGLEFYFISGRPGGSGSQDIWVTTRKTKDSPWGPPVNLGPKVNSTAPENGPSISADGLELYFSEAIWSGPSPRTGGMGGPDIWVTTRKSKDDQWGSPVNLGPSVNSPDADTSPSISADGLSLYFLSKRPGFGETDIWVTTRKSKEDPWSPPVNLGPTVNAFPGGWNPDISSDGSTLYFCSGRGDSQGNDIWQVSLTSKAKPPKSLIHAAATGDIQQVKVQISKGADVNQKTTNGETALHYAAKHGHKDVADLLMAKGADVNSKNNNGATPLHLAMRGKYKEVIDLLVAKGADVSSIHFAAYMGDLARVSSFVEQGTDVDSKDSEDCTALHYAAAQGNREVVEFLVGKGADVNSRDKNGIIPLHWAGRYQYQDIVELFISKGADINARDKFGWTPLDAAVEYGHLAIAEVLIKAGSNVNSRYRWGETPLTWAALGGYVSVAELLIKKGADVGAQDEAGRTPLHHASRNGHERVIQLLISKGADVNAKEQSGLTPLDFAAWYEPDRDTSMLLIDKGADVNAKRNNGRTALHEACMRGSKDMAELLVSKGAVVNAKDNYGSTPLSLAKDQGHEEIVGFLRKHGAKE